MKKLVITITSFLFLLTTLNAFSQSNPGPSDVTTTPPSTISTVGKIIGISQTISLTGPLDTNQVSFPIYHWYKLDAAGNKTLTSVTAQNYKETPTTSGYYNYELVTENANGCTSPISNEFQVFVLPPIPASVTAQNSTICTGIGTTTLTSFPATSPTYAYTYQWTRNGIIIPGATQNTYTINSEPNSGTINYGVSISYVLNSAVSSSASQSISVTPQAGKPVISAN